MTHTLRIGDRVAYTNQNGEPVTDLSYGEIGTVVDVRATGSIGIDFDRQISAGHTCEENAREGHGWYVNPDHLIYLYENVGEMRPLTEGQPPQPYRVIRPQDNTQSVRDAVREMQEAMRNGAGVGMDVSALRPSGAQSIDDVLDSFLDPDSDTDYRPTARKIKFKASDTFEPPYEPENREVKPLKLNELTQGLPLLGLRIMINPEQQRRYRDKYHGKSGIIVSLRGNNRDAYRQITRFKRGETVTDWSCTVVFDDGNSTDVRIGDMLPVTPEKEVVFHELYFDNGERMRWTPEQYEAEVDKYVITYQWGIKKHTLWNDEERQKVLDAH